MKSLFLLLTLLCGQIEDRGMEPTSLMEWKNLYWVSMPLKHYKGEMSWTARNEIKFDFVQPELAITLLNEKVEQDKIGFNYEKRIITRKFYVRNTGWLIFIETDFICQIILEAIELKDKTIALFRKFTKV